MMSVSARWAVAAITAVTLTVGVATAQPKPAAPAAAATAVRAAPAAVLFLDRGSILTQSAVGKNMYDQVQVLVKKISTDLAPEDKQLAADVQALQKIATTLAPDVRQKKIAELEARRAAFQNKAQARQAAIQMGLANARAQVEKALSPILAAIMTERGANLLFDRGLVVQGDSRLDVTPLVIQRLNAALPKLTVTPVAPPAAPPAAGKPNG